MHEGLSHVAIIMASAAAGAAVAKAATKANVARLKKVIASVRKK